MYTLNKELISRIALVGALAVLYTTVSSCGSGGGGGGGSDGATGPSGAAIQTSTSSQWNGSRITGTVKNLNSAKISFVSVEFDLVDDKNRTLLTVSAKNDSGIEPNGEWSFDIPASVVRARSSRLKQTVAR